MSDGRTDGAEGRDRPIQRRAGQDRALGPFPAVIGHAIVGGVDVTTPATSTPATVLPAEAVAGIEEEPLGTVDGARHRVLWRDAESMAGVLTVAAGRRLGLHTHRVNHHHLWVLEGRATIVGTEVGPGSYAHVPSGVEHDIDATATEGCTVFYLYIRPAG